MFRTKSAQQQTLYDFQVTTKPAENQNLCQLQNLNSRHFSRQTVIIFILQEAHYHDKNSVLKR
jgi:hypothetical protein